MPAQGKVPAAEARGRAPREALPPGVAGGQLRSEADPHPLTGGSVGATDCQIGIDYLAFTFAPSSARWREDLQAFVGAAFHSYGWSDRPYGWHGYESAAHIGDGSVLVAWGGEAQRGSIHVEITGRCCGACSSWEAVVLWLGTVGARVTRLDVAADDLAGGALSLAWAKDAYAAGGFTVRGQTPRAQLIDDMGSGTGSTIYFGRRENGKLIRVYEKGLQLGSSDHAGWVRCEVELRAKGKTIPVAALLQPRAYLSGAAPALEFLSEGVLRRCVGRLVAQLELARVVRMARIQAGRVVHVLLQLHGGDLGEVVNTLHRPGMPARLSQAFISQLGARGSP